MIIRIFLTFLFSIYSIKSFSTNIRVLDFDQIIENNINISNLYNQIEKDQKTHKLIFENEELNLENELKRIEKLKLILETKELEKEIENYNSQLSEFNKKIEKFNLHYEKQINDLRNKIINITLDILKKYSHDNNIDIILGSNNYILSSNSVNITDLIIKELNKLNIELNFEKY